MGEARGKCVHKFLPINVILEAVDEQDIFEEWENAINFYEELIKLSLFYDRNQKFAYDFSSLLKTQQRQRR